MWFLFANSMIYQLNLDFGDYVYFQPSLSIGLDLLHGQTDYTKLLIKKTPQKEWRKIN